MKKNQWSLLILLGLFAAFAPLVNNTYQPGVGSLITRFGIAESEVHWGLTASMLGLALGQLLLGPLSDRFGRKKPLTVSLIVFAAVSVALVFAPSMGVFVALRLVQGLAASGAIVSSRAIATDLFSGHDLLTVFAVINVVNGLAPIVTPLGGGALVGFGGWQAVFVAIAIIGLAVLLWSVMLPESLPLERRATHGMLQTFKRYGIVMTNKRFMGFMLHQGAAEMILFGNLASAAVIIQSHYGMSASSVGITLAVNGVFTAIGAGIAAKFPSAQHGVKVCCIGIVVMSALLLAIVLAGLNFWCYEAVMNLLLLFMGITLSSSSSLALESERRHAGTASALFGAMGFVVGAIAAPLTGIGDTMFSTAVTMFCGALLATAFARFAARQAQV